MNLDGTCCAKLQISFSIHVQVIWTPFNLVVTVLALEANPFEPVECDKNLPARFYVTIGSESVCH